MYLNLSLKGCSYTAVHACTPAAEPGGRGEGGGGGTWTTSVISRGSATVAAAEEGAKLCARVCYMAPPIGFGKGVKSWLR